MSRCIVPGRTEEARRQSERRLLAVQPVPEVFSDWRHVGEESAPEVRAADTVRPERLKK